MQKFFPINNVSISTSMKSRTGSPMRSLQNAFANVPILFKDSYNNIFTIVDLNDTTTLNFNVVDVASSCNPDRFKNKTPVIKKHVLSYRCNEFHSVPLTGTVTIFGGSFF
jgi:hypothetical protein